MGYIRSLIDERQKLVSALDKEIEALVPRREDHATFANKDSALLSPVRRILNDILPHLPDMPSAQLTYPDPYQKTTHGIA